jgi:ribosomal protein S6--L-glutamate ligase
MWRMKMNKYIKLFEEFSTKNPKVLIINFMVSSVSTEGTEDKFAEGFKSASNILASKLKEKEITPIIAEYSDVVISNEGITVKGESLDSFSFVFLGLMAKKMELANIILDFLKKSKIEYFSYGTPKDKGNKLEDMWNLSQKGLPYIPTFVSSTYEDSISYIKENKWKFPVVVKNMDSAGGKGVSKADNEEELKELFSRKEEEKHQGNFESFKMIQKFIPNDGDYRVLIFDGKIIAIAKRWSEDEKEFRNNMSLGGKGKKEDLPKTERDLAISAAKVTGKDMAGVDLIQSKNDKKWYIMEVNSSPQYHYFSEIQNLDYPELVANYIEKKI